MNCIHCDTPITEDNRFCPSCGADVSDPSSGPRTLSDVTIEDRLREVVEGHYDIKRLLGRGGMASVYLAQDLKLGRQVAIKVLPPVMSHDDKFVRRFQREAQTSAQLEHRNIIPIYAVESERAVDYFVMKFVDGQTLEQVMKEGPTIERCQQILWEAARGLAHAHQHGIIHRDIKPANIMVDKAGHVVITDFGISKALESATQVTETGQIVGTPHYMSPEQAKGSKVDGRSDQYSLAVLGFRMLTGRLPFQDESMHTILYKHIFEDAPPVREFNPDAPEFLADALQRGLAKDPDDRFQTMEEFATAVWPEHPIAAPAFVPPPLSQPTPAVDHTPTPATVLEAPKKKRSPIPWIAGSAAGFVAVVLWFVLQLAPPAADPAVVAAAQDTAPVVAVAPPETVVVTTPTPAPPPIEQPPRQPVAAAAPARPAAPAAPQVGYFTTNAVPFGTVQIDGVDIGDTPIRRHELPPGTYVITVYRDGYVTETDTITVTVGNDVRRTYRLRPVQ